ncbi:MAG: hypothetical protein H8K03_07065 [Nitrospira sp.]|jgi:hypothetical protein|nr:hypothetical protein [Nitrospira sp. BO4]
MDRIVFENFIRASLEVTDAFENDCLLTDMDQLRLDNYLAIMQMSYIEWKRRNLFRNDLSGNASDHAVPVPVKANARRAVVAQHVNGVPVNYPNDSFGVVGS